MYVAGQAYNPQALLDLGNIHRIAAQAGTRLAAKSSLVFEQLHEVRTVVALYPPKSLL